MNDPSKRFSAAIHLSCPKLAREGVLVREIPCGAIQRKTVLLPIASRILERDRCLMRK